jgi:HEAT repeat protein
MAKARSFDAKLAALRQLRGAPKSPELQESLRATLRDRSNLLVAEAATIAGEVGLAELVPDLVQAFERFLEDPVKQDKLCRAKVAIIEALNKMEYADEAFYLRGVRYQQLEPAYGQTKPNDTGVPVRVASAFALVRLGHPRVMELLVDLLVDEYEGARAGAIQALTYVGTQAAALLVRFKARLGDEKPEVVSECFAGLLEMTPETAVPFVAEFLDLPSEAIQAGALLALGSSRRPEAFEVLRAFRERPTRGLEEVALTALAVLRLPAATDYLIALVATEREPVAAAAVAALAIHRHDSRIRERVAIAVDKNGKPGLQAVFEKKFPVGE